jgi:hypothetical protein
VKTFITIPCIQQIGTFEILKNLRFPVQISNPLKAKIIYPTIGAMAVPAILIWQRSFV